MSTIVVRMNTDRPDEVSVIADGKRIDAWLSKARGSWRQRGKEVWIANEHATAFDVARMIIERKMWNETLVGDFSG